MLRVRAWVVILLLVILSALLISFFGARLVSTAWGGVLLNIFSGFYFVIIVVAVFGTIYRSILLDTLTFFGIQRGLPIQIYISTHSDPHTRTNEVQTAAERQAADELERALARQFPESVDFWAARFGFSPQAPDIVVEGSPLEHIGNWAQEGGLILIGGPTRNSLTELFLRVGNPPITFDDNRKLFLIRRTLHGQYQELQNSHRLALVERLIVGGRVVIIAFGFGEVETRVAVRHLIAQWKILARKCKDCEFCQLLFIDENGLARVQEELSFPKVG